MSRSYRLSTALCLLFLLSVLSPTLITQSAAQTGRLPLIFLPGLAGSRMENDPDGDGKFSEVWPDGARLVLDPWDRSLLALRLAPNGTEPYSPERQYATVRVGDVIRREFTLDFYASTISYFTGPQGGYVEGKDFFPCPYDWRKDIREIAYGDLENTLDACIQTALARNPGAGKVNILAHSMGGLVARAYLADPARAARVGRLVTLGSPYLGAPKIALALLDQLCFAEWMGICFTNKAVLHELIQNFPSGYQIAPGKGYYRVYPQGFIRRDRDADGDGRRDGYLDAAAAGQLLEERNPLLAREAALYREIEAAWTGGAQGTEVFVIAGDQHASIGALVEYERRPWYNPWAAPKIAYRAEVVNGDGTVPLRSADMRSSSSQVDLSGGLPVFYFNLEHSELAKNPAVLGLAAEIFSASGPADPGLLARSQQAAPEAAPRTAPLPLNGVYLTIDGPVEVMVNDAGGGLLQEQRPGVSPEGESGAAAIRGASLTGLEETDFLFLPAGGRYTLQLEGETSGRVEVRLEQILGDEVAQTVLYSGLPVGANSRMVLDLESGSLPGDLRVDLDGDGIFEAARPASAVLDAQQSRDYTPPEISVRLTGAIGARGAFEGPVTVSLLAEDNAGGSGVALLEYSLDGGETALEYRGPFQVEPGTVKNILIRALDRNGNSALAERPLVPERLFLPLLRGPG